VLPVLGSMGVVSLRPVGSAHLQLAASMATALSLAAAAAEPAPVCPSTIDVNSSFVPHAPFQTIVGAKVATPKDCIAICCDVPNCTEWIHSTSFGYDDLAGSRDSVASNGCTGGEPCCQLHACDTDRQKGCHHNIHPHSAKITSGRPTPFKLQFAGVFGDDMILQRAPSSATIYGMALPNHEVLIRVTASQSNQGDSTSAEDVELRDRASATGAWAVRLPAHDAGGSYTIQLSCPECPGTAEMATIERVSFGDVRTPMDQYLDD
jgi:hypothetical protein